jgi:hypothetical protein
VPQIWTNLEIDRDLVVLDALRWARPPTYEQIWCDPWLDLKLTTLAWEIDAQGGNNPIAEFHLNRGRNFYSRWQRSRSQEARWHSYLAITRAWQWLAQFQEAHLNERHWFQSGDFDGQLSRSGPSKSQPKRAP